MYFFVGKMMVLQPDRDLRFISHREPYHDMLPAQPGLWVLRQPNQAAITHKQVPTLAAMANGEFADAGHAAVKSKASAKSKPNQSQARAKSFGSNSSSKGLDNRRDLKDSETGSQQVSVALARSKESSKALILAATRKGKPAASLKEAVMDLMNYPHPLDTLGDPGAYGPDGAISRYHNPDHYCRAIGGVLRARTKPLRMSFKSPRWYLHLQEKEQAMKRRVKNLRHARHESKQQQQIQMELQKQYSLQKPQPPPPSVLNEWKRASQHAG